MIDFARADRIARTVLYEGHVLYPYRASSLKNQQRWSFGGLVPRCIAEARAGSEPSVQRTDCVAIGEGVLIGRVRFLHPMDRRVARCTPRETLNGDAGFEYVREIEVAGRRLITWQEMVEREVELGPISLAALHAAPIERVIAMPASRVIEGVRGADGRYEAAIVREQSAIEAHVCISAIEVPGGVRVRVEIDNTSAVELTGDDQRIKASASLATLGAVHVLLGLEGGARFASIMDPPDGMEDAIAHCENERAWPVLVGPRGNDDLLLCSPIILYDYPEVAPESPTDFFDCAENDELLVLAILSLSDEERAQMAALDDKARDLLQRTAALTPEELARLHGVIRSMRRLPSQEAIDHVEKASRPFTRIKVGGVELRPGDKVVLKPTARADIFDIALKGKIATIASIEQDSEDRSFVTVTVDDDPGKDLGIQGHRFFFGIDEVEPWTA